MRRSISGSNGGFAALIAGTVLLLSSSVSFAGSPTIGTDCGVGAAIVGSDSAGKVTLGEGLRAGTCTLAFSVPYTNAPACTATNETNAGGHPVAVGTKTTTATLELESQWPWAAGDVVSYMCQDY